jgi:PH domain
MMKRKSSTSVIYNIYEATISLNSDYETCPFTGLPAVHLKLMCSPIAGLLTRLERKIFFIQSKDYYAGILDKWILLYPSKSNDMKPSEYFYPKSIGISKSENQFTIVTNGSKRYHFQAPNSQEFNEWVTNIKRIIEEVESGREKELQVPQFLSRKLPSPPPRTEQERQEEEDDEEHNSCRENYYSFGGSKSIDSNDERLYEEPCSNIDLIEEVKEEDDDDEVDMEEKPPELPLKVGKKITNEENHSYDIPKPIKVLENSPEDYDIPRMKISEMTAILSNINLVSPEEKKKIVMKVKRVEEEELVESPKKQSKPSPVRKWFKKRIMREKKISKSPELVDNNEYEENEEEMFASVKGSKVNMIINQLEKTGQLKTLSKGLKSRKSLVYDNEEYETVCVKHS